MNLAGTFFVICVISQALAQGTVGDITVPILSPRVIVDSYNNNGQNGQSTNTAGADQNIQQSHQTEANGNPGLDYQPIQTLPVNYQQYPEIHHQHHYHHYYPQDLYSGGGASPLGPYAQIDPLAFNGNQGQYGPFGGGNIGYPNTPYGGQVLY